MNITVLLDMAVDAFGDRVVVGSRAEGLDARRLRDLSAARADELVASGADALIYLDVNGPAFPIAMFAAARAGIPLVPLNYRLGHEQLGSLLARHPAAVGIGAPGETDTMRDMGIDAVLTAEWLARPASSNSDRVTLDGDTPAALIYTSGTTSSPKAVVIRHSHLSDYVLGTVEFGSAQPEEVALVSLPPYHIAAVANVLTNLYAGRRAMVLERFTPEDWLATVRTEGVSNAMVVPTMLSRIVDCEADKTLPTLRTLAYGGAAMPPRIIERALTIWQDVDFVNAYGLTETSSTIAVLGPEDHRNAVTSADPAVQARLSGLSR